MSIRFGMAAFLSLIALVSGPFVVPNVVMGQDARLTSHGGPTYSSPPPSRPYGDTVNPQGNFGSAYNSGYRGFSPYAAPQPGPYQNVVDGYSTSGPVNYSDGPSVGTSVMMGGQACAQEAAYVDCGPVCEESVAPSHFPPGFYGGFEFLWLRPSFGQDVALIIDPPVGNTAVPFEYDNDLSPRAWLGWQSSRGNGARLTYFRFSDSADPVSVTAVVGATPVEVQVFGAGGNLTRTATANVNDTLTAQHRLKLQAYDIEATQQFTLASTQAMLGFGVRIADIDQMFRADVHDINGVLEEAVSNRLEFRGAGPTASLWLTQQIMASRFSFYSNLRGALLIGDTDQRIYDMKGAYTTELEDRAVHREILTNAECSLGLQFGQSLTPRCGAFLRVGYEAQVWLDAGGPVNSDSTLGFDGATFAMGLSL